jgi:SPP1 family predicted phage head-tail adaptor
MKLPDLNRQLVLESPERVADGSGGFVRSWVVLGEHWADVRPGSGRERAGELLTQSEVTYRIIVRAAPVGSPSRPRPEQRFREGTRLFRINAVTEFDPRGHFLECVAREEEASE